MEPEPAAEQPVPATGSVEADTDGPAASGGEVTAADAEAATAEPRRPQLEPLQPQRRRRWFGRRERVEPEQPPVPDVPKHVRLLPVTARPNRPPEEIGPGFDAAERDERTGG
jgi:hypothetical protein